jgi:hypothetical protein
MNSRPNRDGEKKKRFLSLTCFAVETLRLVRDLPFIRVENEENSLILSLSLVFFGIKHSYTMCVSAIRVEQTYSTRHTDVNESEEEEEEIRTRRGGQEGNK